MGDRNAIFTRIAQEEPEIFLEDKADVTDEWDTKDDDGDGDNATFVASEKPDSPLHKIPFRTDIPFFPDKNANPIALEGHLRSPDLDVDEPDDPSIRRISAHPYPANHFADRAAPVVLLEHPSYAIYNVWPRSPLYRYKLKCYPAAMGRTIEADNTSASFKVLLAVPDCERFPATLTVDTLARFLRWMFGKLMVNEHENYLEDHLLLRSPWDTRTEDARKNIVLDPDDVLDYLQSPTAQPDAGSKKPWQGELTLRADIMRRSEGLRFFLHDPYLLALRQLYDENLLVTMSEDAIKGLYAILRTEAYRLFFAALVPYRYGDTLKALPELANPEGKTWALLLTYHTPQPWHEKAVLIYLALKHQTHQLKHGYTPDYAIHVASTTICSDEETALVEEAIDKLHALGIIVKETDARIYLADMYNWDQAIVCSVEKLVQRQLVSGTIIQPHRTTPYPCTPKHAMCSEQQQALLMQQHLPVLFVAGSAGSGKSDLIANIVSQYEDTEYLCAAFMATVVANLRTRVSPTRSFTAHQLLFHHAKSHLFPGTEYRKLLARGGDMPHWYGDDGSGGKGKLRDKRPKMLGISYENCIFENIALLIIEEVSLMYPEITAKLLSKLVCCSPGFRRLVFVGDAKQLPSIQCGDLATDLHKTLGPLHALIEFRHNHRVRDKAFTLLKENAHAIATARQEEMVFDGKTCVQITPTWNNYVRRYNIDGDILQILQEYHLKEHDTNILTRTNAVRLQINKVCKAYYSYLDEQNATQRKITEYVGDAAPPRAVQLQDLDIGRQGNANVLRVGRKIVFKRNKHDRGITNNEILVLKQITEKRTVGSTVKETSVKQTSKRVQRGTQIVLICYPLGYPTQLREIEFDDFARKWVRDAYATTNHAFQGAQIRRIVYAIPFDSEFETRRSLYTGSTRCEENIIYLAARKTIAAACTRDEPPRRSHLAQRLLETLTPIFAFPMPDLTAVELLRLCEDDNGEPLAMATDADLQDTILAGKRPPATAALPAAKKTKRKRGEEEG